MTDYATMTLFELLSEYRERHGYNDTDQDTLLRLVLRQGDELDALRARVAELEAEASTLHLIGIFDKAFALSLWEQRETLAARVAELEAAQQTAPEATP